MHLVTNLMLVAPYVGAWIETFTVISIFVVVLVAPYVGAWIETLRALGNIADSPGRTLRGCVD